MLNRCSVSDRSPQPLSFYLFMDIEFPPYAERYHKARGASGLEPNNAAPHPDLSISYCGDLEFFDECPFFVGHPLFVAKRKATEREGILTTLNCFDNPAGARPAEEKDGCPKESKRAPISSPLTLSPTSYTLRTG